MHPSETDVLRELSANLDDSLPAEIRAHLPLAAQASQRNVVAARESSQGALSNLSSQLRDVMSARTPAKTRPVRIRFLAGKWSELYSKHSACRSGCSHCCHIDVAVPRSEAELIAKATKAPMDKAPGVAYTLSESERGSDFFKVPCTFLKEGECSIYEHRPLACRTLLNMDDSDLLCRLVEGCKVPVPYADSSTLQAAFAIVAGQEQEWADIRNWFPSGLAKKHD